ncbi:MAG: hypothetical protein WAT12_14615 [Candidatus Nitrotoga sp.]
MLELNPMRYKICHMEQTLRAWPLVGGLWLLVLIALAGALLLA